MIEAQAIEKIRELANSICQREGCILYDLEYVGNILRVYIDREIVTAQPSQATSSDIEEPGQVASSKEATPVEGTPGEAIPVGAGIDDCTNISRALNLQLDDEDLIPNAYTLEVSTPGADRILRRPWHFAKVLGKKVWVKIQKPLSEFGVSERPLVATKQFTALLVSADESTGPEFELNGIRFSIPYTEIQKAKLVFEIEKNKKKPLNDRKRTVGGS